MAKLEDTLAQGIKDSKIPYVVVFATNADGSSPTNWKVLMQLTIDQAALPTNALLATTLVMETKRSLKMLCSNSHHKRNY